jgi:hypothetical protein
MRPNGSAHSTHAIAWLGRIPSSSPPRSSAQPWNKMKPKVHRRTADLSGYPDLAVI